MNTSHAAYLTINTTELEELVYKAVLTSKTRGVIADELEAMMHMRSNVITPRFAPLERKGRIYRPGNVRRAFSGRAQLVMYADKYAQRVSDQIRRKIKL